MTGFVSFFVSEMCSDCSWELLQFTNKPQKSKTRMKHKCLKSARVECGEIHFIMCITVSRCGWVTPWCGLSCPAVNECILLCILFCPSTCIYQSSLDAFIISQRFESVCVSVEQHWHVFFQNLYYCYSETPLWQMGLCEFNLHLKKKRVVVGRGCQRGFSKRVLSNRYKRSKQKQLEMCFVFKCVLFL